MSKLLASLLLPDAGGVQEESCMLKVPCVTLHENTKRPETIDTGSHVLPSTHPETIPTADLHMVDIPRTGNNPFGDGDASHRIDAGTIRGLFNDRKCLINRNKCPNETQCNVILPAFKYN